MAAGAVRPEAAWPQWFTSPDDMAFPQKGADMSEFSWEHPTPESYQADLDAMLAGGQSVSVREPPAPDPAPPPPLASSSLEWT